MTDIKLHLGAHKTATTFIQNSLHDSRAKLREKDIIFVPLWPFRYHYKIDKLAGKERLPFQELVWETNKVRGKRHLEKAYIFSDENLIGSLDPLCERGFFYPGMKSHVAKFREWLPEVPSEIYFSTRNYADFFTAAYLQWITPGGFLPFDGEVKERLFNTRRRWPDVIADIHASFPNAKLTLWRYEDFAAARATQETILEYISTLPIDEMNIDWEKKSNPSITLEGVKIIEFAGKMGFRHTELRDVLKRHPIENGTPVKPLMWSKSEIEELDGRYAEDCAIISREFGWSFGENTDEKASKSA